MRITAAGRWLGLLAAAGLLVAGCGGGSSGGSSGGDQGNVLRLAQEAEPTTLDPARVQDGPTIELMMQVFNGLVQWTKENRLAPDLAEKWDVTDGGKTYTFHLRKGVSFHNGQPLTAEDIVYSITRSLNPATGSPVAMTYLNDILGASDFYNHKTDTLKGVEAVDDGTVRIRIDAPRAYFLSKLTYPTAYAVCKAAIEKTGGKVTEESMIGTGPFKLTEYRRGQRLVLEPNAEYWEGAPKLARLERQILLDSGTRHDKFEAGELDIAPNLSRAEYRGDKSNPKLGPLLHLFERPSVYYMALNQRFFAPFKNARVRQAFAHAIDKDQIIQQVHLGVPRKAEGIIPYGVPGFDPSFKGLEYDPALAKKLLAEAGFPNGQGFPPLTLSFRANVEDIRRTAEAVQAQLRDNLGISVNLDAVEWATFLDRRNRGDMPLYFLRWAADYLDPQDFLSVMLRTGAPENGIGYSNPQFDHLCDQADVGQNPDQRFALYRQAEKIAVGDAPWIPIFFEKDIELWNPRLRGVEDSLMGHLPHKRTYFGSAQSARN